nr:rRNA 2'-O-methyltransferase fibrillarin-like [Aegilops tauschii subsp. strangulata]
MEQWCRAAGAMADGAGRGGAEGRWRTEPGGAELRGGGGRSRGGAELRGGGGRSRGGSELRRAGRDRAELQRTGRGGRGGGVRCGCGRFRGGRAAGQRGSSSGCGGRAGSDMGGVRRVVGVAADGREVAGGRAGKERKWRLGVRGRRLVLDQMHLVM